MNNDKDQHCISFLLKIIEKKPKTGSLLRTTATLLLFAGILSSTTVAQQDIPFANNRQVRVLTRNAYHGVDAEFSAAAASSTFPQLLARVAAVYNGYIARDFPARAELMAAEIEATRPDLIGLQEAVLVRTGLLFNPAPAETVALDYVQILIDALAARGLQYTVVVQSIGFDIEAPSALGFDVRHTDREVILARSDLTTADLKLSNRQAGHFAVNCTIPGGIVGRITILRGWVSVDAKIRGKSFRVVSTHLDGDCLPFTSAIQNAQAAELMAGPLSTELSLVLLGDLNSPADGTGGVYNSLIASGFADTWSAAGIGSGFTCCQAGNLLNPVSTLGRRIDVVLTRNGLETLSATVVGDNPAIRTPFGLWPSDHAGVAAVLKLPQN